MKKYVKPEIQVKVLNTESIIMLSGVGTQTLDTSTSKSFKSLGLNS